ncbi:hypothetical protein TTHERM_00266460 (macronuclear) [Tetrahymena thermophila SB210]|uniref:Next to BRCA1 central domain-containing protein n=1 Tax=Tetrahymena thermophila (strain SB210) TaxID=312017 RepID=I7LUP4_TETTS|nr:hypothetical protein TTHERM_00266460 [Tetrahymena thermophila SB210]EAR95636.2 hypothetical protein TTHERM_00266460 [Tetrahymena thermophila SB210]|eukprot:XP_001015881.2 hypothetical protein TTHERM_00266460 [Tetrahymena thermophila SB210]
MKSQSLYKSSIEEVIARKESQQMENHLVTNGPNAIQEKNQQQELLDAQNNNSHQNNFAIDVELKLYIGQDVYKRKQKVNSYEDLLQLAQDLLKNHHIKIEGKVVMKYVDLDKDNVHINDQQSYQTAVEEIQNSQQKNLKVFAELIQINDNNQPNLSQSFCFQKGSICSNCSSFNLQTHPNDSLNNLEYLNQIISRTSSQNGNSNTMTTSQSVNVENQGQIHEENIQKEKQNGIKTQNMPNKIFSPTGNSTANVINFNNQQQTPLRRGISKPIPENLKSQLPLNFENFSNEQVSYNFLASQDQLITSPKDVNQNQLNLLNKGKHNQQQTNQYQSNQQQQQQQRQISSITLPPPYSLQAMFLNQLDPNYQQFLLFKEYFQNIMNIQSPQSIQGLQNDMDLIGKKNLFQFGAQIHKNSQSQTHSLQNYQEHFEPNLANHRYSNSLNNDSNIKDNQALGAASFSSDFSQNRINQKKEYRVNTSLDEGINSIKQVYQGLNQQKKDKQTSYEDQQTYERNLNNQNINSNIPQNSQGAKNSQAQRNGSDEIQNHSITKNFKSIQSNNNVKHNNSNKNSQISESYFKNQISSFGEQDQINIDDLDSFKSQKLEDSNSLKGQLLQKQKNNVLANNNSTDSDHTGRENSVNSNYYYNGFNHEIQQTSFQQMVQQDTYHNISQVDCFSLSTSKEDKQIPSVIANNLYIFDTPSKIKQTRQVSPVKSQQVENQSKVTLVNEKTVSQSVQQNIFKSNQLESIQKELQNERANQYGFEQFIEQSIVIQKSKDDSRENNIPQYFHTLKQIQKKTVEELKKDPNCTQCVQEMLSNEKCKFCKKNLICKYKDKQKLIMTVVSHKIKEILPFLRPIIESQIEKKKRKTIRAFSYQQQVQQEFDQQPPSHIAQSENINKIDNQKNQENVSSSVPLTQLDVSFNQKYQQNQNSPQTLMLLQKNSSNQTSREDKQQDNKQIDMFRDGLNDYTFQNLNEQFLQGGLHRYSFGSNHKSPKNSISFDNSQSKEKNNQNGEQKLHSFNEFPDEQYLQAFNQFNSHADKIGNSYQEEEIQQQLYANFQKNSQFNNLFQIPHQEKQSKFYIENQQEQIDFFNELTSLNNKNEGGQQIQNNNFNNLINNSAVPLKKQVSQNTAAFLKKVEGEFDIYDDFSNEEEESKEYDMKNIFKNNKSKNGIQKHELTQPYQVEVAEYSQNQIIDCYPGEKRDILIEIKNVGKKNWDINNFYLKCIKGVFEKTKFSPSQKLAVGQDGTIHMQVKIPSEIKTYTTQWQMFEIKTNSWEKECSFGPVIKIQFAVREPTVNNSHFWQEVKNQLYQLIDPSESNIDKKIHDFIKNQQSQYNHQQITQAKQSQLIDKIISQFFD